MSNLVSYAILTGVGVGLATLVGSAVARIALENFELVSRALEAIH